MLTVQNSQAVAFGRLENLAGALTFAGASAFVLMLVFGLY